MTNSSKMAGIVQSVPRLPVGSVFFFDWELEEVAREEGGGLKPWDIRPAVNKEICVYPSRRIVTKVVVGFK